MPSVEGKRFSLYSTQAGMVSFITIRAENKQKGFVLCGRNGIIIIFYQVHRLKLFSCLPIAVCTTKQIASIDFPLVVRFSSFAPLYNLVDVEKQMQLGNSDCSYPSNPNERTLLVANHFL